MPRTRDEIREERRRLKAEHGELFNSMSAILFRYDPVCINFDYNTDEYEPETGTILSRLHTCQSEAEVLRVVHEEFVCWFDPVTVGPAERYTQIAFEIWQLWQQYSAKDTTPGRLT
jgi:hypothetical protein